MVVDLIADEKFILKPITNDKQKMKKVEIAKEPVALYKILKFEGLVSSGGEAKHVIADGQVLVNGNKEIQKRKKIVSGDVIEFNSERYSIQLKLESTKES